MESRLLNRLGEWNPQLFRELKGRLKPRNLGIAAAISLVGQALVYLYYKSLLPTEEGVNRYCTGSLPSGLENSSSYSRNFCIKDLLGNWMVIKELWWLDLFIGMSVIGIFALLVVGTHLLIADLSREERRSTLNFIRLSPQSAKSILLGKMLGVPILLYIVGLLALPLHLGAGLAAHIPLSLILSFYGVAIASCFFFYSAALLYGLVSSRLGGFQACLGSGSVFLFLFSMSVLTVPENLPLNHNSLDWLMLFYPGTVLPYLVNSTYLPPATVGYLNGENLAKLLWYGQPLWLKAPTGIGFLLVNYSLWAYWIWQGLKRRFHNPMATILSKEQSYWVSGSFAVIAVGFTLQTTESYHLSDNFAVLQWLNLMLFLGLIALLSPHRQALQDWARYRHRATKAHRNLIKDLIWGEKSPSPVAIAVNLAIVTGYTIPSILIFPLKEDKVPILLGLILSANLILIYAAIAQLMLLMRTPKRSIWAGGMVAAMVLFPLVTAAWLRMSPAQAPGLWLLSALPVVATEYATGTTIFLSLLGQWLAIALVNFQMARQLRQAGKSQTKALLSGSQG